MIQKQVIPAVGEVPPDATTSDAELARLPLPPRQKHGLFRNLRDSISYLIDPEKFIAEHTEALGPVFMTHLFFKPTVIVGGQEAVKQFIRNRESQAKVVRSALPDTFSELHTKWGALNLDATDVLHKQARSMFKDTLLSTKALCSYAQYAEHEIDRYVASIQERSAGQRGACIYPARELKELCLQLFSKVFSGDGLTPAQCQMFDDYNNALLSLSSHARSWKKGKVAMQALRREMQRRIERCASDEGSAGRFFIDPVLGRQGFEDEDRIATGMFLFVWGAYIETAALLTKSLILLHELGPRAIGRIRLEAEQKGTEEGKDSGGKLWSDLPFTQGVVRESLRLNPPAGGGFRFSDDDFELCGYRIPAGTVVTLDPRIGNRDPNLFPHPELCEPDRWVSNTSAASSDCPIQGTALQQGPGAWFPGGNGAHACPGVPLAELIAKMFLVKIANVFDAVEFSGSGLTRRGEVKYQKIPIKIPVHTFGMRFRPR